MSGLPFDILVITDRTACVQVNKTVTEVVEQILRSPLSDRIAILVRDKAASQAHVTDVIKTLQPRTQAVGAKLLVHTYPHLALEFGLDGVHVAAHVPLKEVRSQLLPNMLLGASRHAQDPLNAADIGLANYATISPIYRPTSKPNDIRETLGLSGLQSCVQRSVRPLVALGGMRPGRVAEVMLAGAVGAGCMADFGCGAIAISGAILQANNPAHLIEQLCREIDEVRCLARP